jgi:hypothetical protein
MSLSPAKQQLHESSEVEAERKLSMKGTEVNRTEMWSRDIPITKQECYSISIFG